MDTLLMMAVGASMALLAGRQVVSALKTGETGLGSRYGPGRVVIDVDVRTNPLFFVAILSLWLGATALGALITWATAVDLPPALWSLVASFVAGPVAFWLSWYRFGGPDPRWFIDAIVTKLEAGDREGVRGLAARIPTGALSRLARAALDLEVAPPAASSYRERAASPIEAAESLLSSRMRRERRRLDLGAAPSLVALAPFVALPLGGIGLGDEPGAYVATLVGLLPPLFAVRHWWRARAGVARAAPAFARAAVAGSVSAGGAASPTPR